MRRLTPSKSDVPLTPRGSPPVPTVPPSPEAAGPVPGARLRRVLLIDDSEPVHRLVKAWLAGRAILLGARTAAEGLKLAVDAAADEPVDLILLDVDLPQIDGFECCRLLKNDARTAQVPVVFLTAATGTAEKIRGLDLGAVDYITKPFNPAEFRARVNAALRQKELVDLLTEKACIDPLTGLRNRGFFNERLAALTSLARRTGRVFSVVLVDIDGFCGINDRHGYAFGDTVMWAVADVVRRGCRPEDVVCRASGDKLVVLTPDVGERGALGLAERLRAAVEAVELKVPAAGPGGAGGEVARVTCSIGVAGHREDDDVFARADAALYEAKQQGRNRVCAPPADGDAAAQAA